MLTGVREAKWCKLVQGKFQKRFHISRGAILQVDQDNSDDLSW